jgi:phenylacetate-CoA ligase
VPFRHRDYLSRPLRVLRMKRWMNETPYLSRSTMEGEILTRLKMIAVHAARTVPFYRTFFREIGFDPDKLDSLDSWQQLPVLDKNTVRESVDDLCSTEADHHGAVWCETSGSTGTAVRFLLDRNVNAATFAMFWRTWSMAPEWNILKRQAAISAYTDGIWHYSRTTRALVLSCFHLSPTNISKYHELLLHYAPKFLRGFPSSLYLTARLLREQNLKLEFPMIFSGAETLLPFHREVIEDQFRCKLINHYKHWERCASICECIHGRLHAHDDFGYHEILRADGSPAAPGEVGRLVCTGLHNMAMPLLRYDTRDLAVWSSETSCPCGSRFPIVERIIGRIDDVILTPEGNFVARLDGALKYSEHIKQAQIHQTSRESVIVRIVKDSRYSVEADELPMIEELRKRLGNTIAVELDYVKNIPLTRAGKFRAVVSDIEPEQKLGHY